MVKYPSGTGDDKMNNQYSKLLANMMKSSSESGGGVKNNPTGHDGPSGSGTGPMEGNLMTWTKMLESMNILMEAIDDHSSNLIEDEVEDVSNLPVPDTTSVPPTSGGDDELIDQLNKIFTPVLIMQGFENDVSDQIQEAMSEASVFSEKSVIQFDDDTRMAQLISVCARLIARQKNSPKYQMYAKAHEIKKRMSIEIQKDEYDAAKALAQKYLVNVATTNNSPVARNAANNLLPATQH